MQTHYFDCMCSDYGHVFRFVFDPTDGDLWLEVRLLQCDRWYRRLWKALKYVFKRPVPNCGHYDCTLVREEDIPRLRSLLDEAESALQSRQEKPVPGEGG